ncbi:MAG: PKD domain-containing protein [Bacteroidia bacterium]
MKTKFHTLLAIFIMLFIAQESKAQCVTSFTYSVSGGTVAFTNTTNPSTYLINFWNFGDNTPVNNSNSPSHSYSAPGTYSVCLITIDSFSTCTDTFCTAVTVSVGCNNLSVTATSTNETSPSACDGTVSASVTGGSSPYAFQWSNAVTVSNQTNLCSGTYSILVTDVNGCVATDYTNVGSAFACSAGFGSSISGLSANLYNTSNDTMNANFAWDFGDASVGNNVSEYHTYATQGTYTVTLIMFDSIYACTDTFVSPVTVGGPTSCSAYFSMVQDSFNLLQWYIYPSVTGQGPINYLWDFGDATTSSLPNPSHNYTAPGQYTICLTITDGNLCSSMYCDSSSVHRMTSASQMQYATVINPPLSVQEQETFQATIFPNPAGENLNVLLNKPADGKIMLTDLTGKIVYEQAFSGRNISIDVSTLPQGIYNCAIMGSSINQNQKVVIIR